MSQTMTIADLQECLAKETIIERRRVRSSGDVEWIPVRVMSIETTTKTLPHLEASPGGISIAYQYTGQLTNLVTVEECASDEEILARYASYLDICRELGTPLPTVAMLRKIAVTGDMHFPMFRYREK